MNKLSYRPKEGAQMLGIAIGHRLLPPAQRCSPAPQKSCKHLA
jgi:hypothetical protein